MSKGRTHVCLWVAGGIAAVSGFGCGHGGPPRAAISNDARPVLRIGTSGDYAPFTHRGEGFDVDVAERMARDLGYRIQWVAFTWPALHEAVIAERFDVAMSGVTWLPDRAVAGAMSRAVAAGGACLLRRADSTSDRRIGVNRGGVLERWARAHYPAQAIVTVDDNLALPQLLAQGQADVVVTDSFEVRHFLRPAFRYDCEPRRARKVYWIVPSKAKTLAPSIDRWLVDHERTLQHLRGVWFGEASAWGELDHLVDLIDRRLQLMPAVAAYKRRNGLVIEDPSREAHVLAEVLAVADRAGLEPTSVRGLFLTQIELAKAVQRRSRQTAKAPDLSTALRPTLLRQSRQIVAALVDAVGQLPTLQMPQLDLLEPILTRTERERLLGALRQVRVQKSSDDEQTKR